MRTRTSASIALALGLLAAAAAPARAQDFPPDNGWEPFHCGDVNMFDAVADEPTAVDDRDLVGDESQPAGLHYADADYAYLRLRLEEDPSDPGDLHSFAWGFEFDTDGDASTYEVLVIASGVDETITVYTNDSVSIDNSPADPADADPVAVYDFADNGRVVGAGSNFGGDGDSYLDMAVLWDDLEAAGMTPITPVVAWAGSSSSDNALDGDLACHDAADGDPVLDGTGSDEEPIDPNGNGGPDGGPIDPNGPTDLEGGGGCSAAGTGAPLGIGLILFLVVVAARRRAKRGARSSRPSARR